MTATEILNELTILAGHNVGVCARLREFLDKVPIVAALNIDRLATAATGETVYRDEPSEELLACLATCRALDCEADHLAGSVAHV